MEKLHFMEGFEGNEDLVHPDDSKIMVNKSESSDNVSNSNIKMRESNSIMRESSERLKITKSGKRQHSRMLSQQETS